MFWQKIRSGAMFVISAITCPCHLPITLPLILVLLAGTPLAVWIIQHSGWMYGIMTGVFLLSLALGFLWAGSSKHEVGEACEPRQGRPVQAASMSTPEQKS